MRVAIFNSERTLTNWGRREQRFDYARGQEAARERRWTKLKGPDAGNVRPKKFYGAALSRVGSLQSTNSATSAGWIGSGWSGAGTEGEGLHQRMVRIERLRQRTCQSSRRPESRSLLPALRSPSLSCSFGTWGILARFDRRKCLYIKHEACQNHIPERSASSNLRAAEK